MRAYKDTVFFISICALLGASYLSVAYAQTPFPTDISSSINQLSTTTQQQVQNQLELLKEAAKGAGIDQYISLSSTPKYPRANESVTVTIDGFANEIGESNIEWRVNGLWKSEGKGEKSLSFKTGTLGGVFDVKALIDTQAGTHIEKSLRVSVSEVDLLWEARSYVPAFYKGKALYPLQGSVVITALPSVFENGSRVSAKNLLYTWKKDGMVLGSLSGYGKNTLSVEGTFIGSAVTVSVEASSSGGSKALGNIQIEPQTPKILLYEESPLYGVRTENAITSSFIMKEKEITLLSVPFFFNLADLSSGNVTRTWTLNGKTIEGREKEAAITFRQPEEEGASQITVTVNNATKVLQSAQGSMLLKFNKTNTSQQ